MEGAAATHGFLTASLLALVLLGPHTSGCHGVRLDPRAAPTSTEFIRTSCSTTKYPQLCYTSLAAYASEIQTSPMELANTALSLALASARSASAVITRASTVGGMAPRDAAAVGDCVELMGDSVEELRQSVAVMGHLGGRNLGMQVGDMQTWVSAALTDDDTCVEGFTAPGEVKKMVSSHVLKVAQLTSNALALINRLVPTIHSSSAP